jgi:hypothetical protein
MRFFLGAAAVAFAAAAAPAAFADDWGVAVQVNEGAPLPPLTVMQAVTPRGSTVRDALGWHRVEKSRGLYNIPANDWALYKEVAAAGDKNVITLFSGNPIYGTATFGFPTTPEQILAWANYAAYVVTNDGGALPDRKAANIPNLEAVTIWNEFNGTWNGGITDPKLQQAAMAKLLEVVVPVIRKANPNVKIAAGAFVGGSSLATWFEHIQQAGFDWQSVDWLDVHPYIGPLGAANWQRQVAELRAGGITNPFYFSEWGGPVSVNYAAKFEGTPGYTMNYMQWFIANVVDVDAVSPAGGNFFTISNAAQFPGQGLTTGTLTSPQYQLTPLGAEYLRYFAPWAAAVTVAGN